MNDTSKASMEAVAQYPLPMEVLMDPKYSHRYINPETGALREPEDIRQNELFWSSIGKPREIKIRP